MTEPIVLQLNGKEHKLEVDPDRTLLDVLRDELGLLGTKYGCGEGQCGACAVLVDGQDQRSCQLRIGFLGGRQVRTIEGLADGERLHPVQQAFLDCGAMQCGYCTSGMIVAAVALLQRNPAPDAGAIRRGLQGNLCRCCVYPRIVAAVQQAARAGAGKGEGSKSGGGR